MTRTITIGSYNYNIVKSFTLNLNTTSYILYLCSVTDNDGVLHICYVLFADSTEFNDALKVEATFDTYKSTISFASSLNTENDIYNGKTTTGSTVKYSGVEYAQRDFENVLPSTVTELEIKALNGYILHNVTITYKKSWLCL